MITSNDVRVSIIVPTYRPGEYLWDCLRSLERQTFPREWFEVLVVFNGNMEPYAGQLDVGLSRFDLNVRLLHTGICGVSNARNVGIEEAVGTGICFVDDDDWVSESYIADLYEKLQDDIVVVSNLRTCNGGVLGEDYVTRAFRRHSKTPRGGIMRMQSFMSSACAKMIPRSVIGNSRFDCRYSVGEDSLFMASISYRIRSLVLSPSEAIYYRRLTPGSASRQEEPAGVKAARMMKVSVGYLRIYLSAPWRYSFLFMTSRIARTVVGVIRRQISRSGGRRRSEFV
ncbi:MAG: glycosyltransferase [Gemmatimonadota bacterium]|jgi:glycosyltransferase involved in cell wall biosynthesis|nr:glycosyltransferase [Gemmatimonadota bacterium]